MCVYSMVSQYARCRCFPEWNTITTPNVTPLLPFTYQLPQTLPSIEELQKQIDEIKHWMQLLDHAKQVDAATGQPNCESPEEAAEKTKVEDALRLRIKELETENLRLKSEIN